MDRLARAVALAALVCLAAAGCGDPVLVRGEWPGIMRIAAGVPDSTSLDADSLAVATPLSRPRGLAIGDDGVLYIADAGAPRLLAVTSAGRMSVLVNHWGCPADPCLRQPRALALDGKGGLLIADPMAHRLWRWDLAAKRLDVLGGTGEEGHSPDGAPLAGSPLAFPSGVAVGDDGTVYITELRGHRVREVRADGTLATVAGAGSPGYGGDGGPATEATLAAPEGLAVHDGTLYIADTGNHRVRAVDLSTGTVRTAAGTGSPVYGGDGGPAAAAQLSSPAALAVAADGAHLFIADAGNHRVRALDLRSFAIETFAGTGDPEYNGDAREAGATALSSPAGLAASPHNLLFISDTGHHLVWRTPIGL